MKVFLSGWVVVAVAAAPVPIARGLAADDFDRSIRPLLREHCLSCHSTAERKGELDLERFDALDRVKRDAEVWERVREQVELGEMPPKRSKPLSEENRRRLLEWVAATLDEIAEADAGDPGRVVLRRLSNHEYTYSIRDLTGIASLDPAREFPPDGAAGEGFSNVGEALAMSPALLSKYIDAAKEVAGRLVPLEDGVRFSPSDSPRDWTDEALANLRRFYATRAETTELVNEVPGTGLVKSEAGTIPLARYLDALAGRGPADDLSPKYLGILERTLKAAEAPPSPILDSLRGKFRQGRLTPADVEAWQSALWKFNTVGHIGRAGGPKSWQEPRNPLAERREFRVRLAAGGASRLFLIAGTAGDGDDGDRIVWENPRIVAEGRPDVPLAIAPEALNENLLTLRASSSNSSIEARAPSALEIEIPAGLLEGEGAEFAVVGRLADPGEGSAQLLVAAERPSEPLTGARADLLPIVVGERGPARAGLEAAFDEFRGIFPAALCYSRIVPIDEVVTLNLFHREDEPLRRLMLSDAEADELDRLWRELLFIAETPIRQLDAFEQIYQFATQDRPDLVVEFEHLREPFRKAAAEFLVRKEQAVAAQRRAVLDLASRAWRRPLTEAETASLEGMPPRLALVRALASPAFLYRGETPGEETGPLNDWELATRLSYFLWSSLPDDELRAEAAAGRLRDPEVLIRQTRRMLRDDRIRRLATEFGAQYLQVRDLDALDEKSERHFPTFKALRESMREEVVRFYVDLFQNNRGALSLLNADHTFLNEALADHYGIPFEGTGWRRVDGIGAYGRGGALGFSATLAKQSGASRTSAILRGAWVAETLLGERIPDPPKDVPVLPEEPPAGLDERRLVELHTADPRCAGCHRRFDPYGFALEGFDAIGRSRPADAKTIVFDGTPVDGLAGLRNYLATDRRDDFLRQFARKLLGYALGRSVQPSDRPLIDELVAIEGAPAGTMIERIVLSPQFRRIRGGR